MKNNSFARTKPSSLGYWLIIGRAAALRQSIKKKVLTDYQEELEQAVGWKKRWIKWKINYITEVRYRGIIGLGPNVL